MTRATARFSRLTASAIALAMLSSCAGGAKTAAPKSSTNAKADRDLAKAIVFTKVDFPRDWKSEAPKEGSGAAGDRLTVKLLTCTGVTRASGTAPVVSIDGRTFLKADASVTSNVTVAPTVQAARLDSAGLRSKRFPGCLQKHLGEQVKRDLRKDEPDARLSSFKVRKVAIRRIGDTTVAYRLTMGISVGSITVPAYVDMVFATRRRVLVTAVFTDIRRPFASATQRRLLSRLSNRLTTYA